MQKLFYTVLLAAFVASPALAQQASVPMPSSHVDMKEEFQAMLAKAETINLKSQYDAYKALTKMSTHDQSWGTHHQTFVNEVLGKLGEKGIKNLCTEDLTKRGIGPTVRILHPEFMLITQDLHSLRLNIILNQDYNIVDLYCG